MLSNDIARLRDELQDVVVDLVLTPIKQYLSFSERIADMSALVFIRM